MAREFPKSDLVAKSPTLTYTGQDVESGVLDFLLSLGNFVMSMRARARLRTATLLATFGAAFALSGCSEADDGTSDPAGDCEGAKCDSADDEGNLEADLDGRTDAIARYLRAELQAGRLSGDGLMKGDYLTVLEGVAAIQGCDTSSIRTFVVSDTLLSAEPFPRIVSTVCSGNKAAEFFISAPEERFDRDTDEPTGDLELQFIEMFAFDKEKDEYVFYETFPTNDEATMAVNPSPTRCQQCHLTPSDFAPDGMRMTPIMNELTQPWTHWNGEPGFSSHSFTVPDRAKNTRTWNDLIEPFLAPAAEFEKLVRRGHFLAAKERRKAAFKGEPTWENAMNLMRPVFCNEQVQYVTSKGGQVLDSVIVDPSIGSRLTELGHSYDWLKAPPNNLLELAGNATIDQIPVRGNADMLLENQLIGRGLTSEQVLRARALDWQNPVFSGLRCEFWTDAYSRYATGSPPNLGGAAELEDALSVVFEDVMRELPAQADGRFIALGSAGNNTLGEVAQALANGTIEDLRCTANGGDACVVTPVQLGDFISVWVDEFESASDAAQRLTDLRDERVCHVVEQAPVEQRPVPARSGRFTLQQDIGRCAEICCDREGIEPDPEDLEWLRCESTVSHSIEDTVNRNGTELESCALECGLPTRYANRPSLPKTGVCEPPNFFWPFGTPPRDENE